VQDAPPRNPPAIVITGTALPEAKSVSAYTVERIDRRTIAQSPSHQLDEVLKQVAGLQLFRRSDATSGHPTSQGVTLRALGGNASSRALLILDGVPQTDPFGGWVNWPAYDPSMLAGVRIIRGGGSVTDGPGALAGTIDMVSRMDAGTSGDLFAGSRSSLEGSGRAGFAIGDGLFTISGRAARSSGFIPITEQTRGPVDQPAPYREWSGRSRLVAPLGGDVEAQATIDGFHDFRTRGTDFTQNRTNGADASLRLVGRGAWQWSALGYWQWRNLMSSFASVSDRRLSASRVSLQDSVPSRGLGASAEVRPPLGANIELRLGADARRTTGESREFYSYSDGQPTRRRLAGGETWTAGAFAETTASLGEVILTGGARVDHWIVSDGHLFERILASGDVTRDEHDPKRGGRLPTGRAGASFSLGTVKLRSAAYLGWRMPTLNELFRPFRAGADATAANPALDPERLAGIEAGADWTRGPFHLTGTIFANRLRHAIANVTLGEGPGTFPGVGVVGPGGLYRQRQNIDAVTSRGLEASASWSSGPWLLRTDVSWTHARVSASGSAAPLDGLQPAQTAPFAATLSAGWQRDGRSAELLLEHVGPQFEDDLNTRQLKPATTVGAFLAWPLSRRLQIVARGENLLNATVEAGLNSDGSIERATPRTLWIGLRLR